MSFDWGKFIELAEKLQQEKSEEAFRTAVSRAYYGVFCPLRNLKRLRGYTTGNVHRELIDRLKASQNKTEQEIGQILDDLRKERNHADYDERKPIGEKLSQRCINRAKEILKYLRKP